MYIETEYNGNDLATRLGFSSQNFELSKLETRIKDLEQTQQQLVDLVLSMRTQILEMSRK